jgi:hypothetical protein
MVDIKVHQRFIRTTFEFQGEMPVAILCISDKPHVAVHKHVLKLISYKWHTKEQLLKNFISLSLHIYLTTTNSVFV